MCVLSEKDLGYPIHIVILEFLPTPVVEQLRYEYVGIVVLASKPYLQVELKLHQWDVIFTGVAISALVSKGICYILYYSDSNFISI